MKLCFASGFFLVLVMSLVEFINIVFIDEILKSLLSSVCKIILN